MQKIMVLGGAGFIGSNFVNYSSKFDSELCIVDKLTYAGRRENISEALNYKNWKFYQTDICDKENIEKIIQSEQPHFIINFAAETHVSRSITDPSIFIQSNVVGVHAVLEAVRNFSPKTFVIHISTDEVFGQLSEWQAPWKDYDALNPRSPYAASKASGELIVRSYFSTYGLDVAIVRPSNCFGPMQYPEKLIPRAVTNLLEGDKIPLMGEGLQMRDWLYVEDLCHYLWRIIARRPTGECFNIPGHSIHRNRDIIKKILQYMHISWDDGVETIPHRLAHDFKYHVEGEGIAKLPNIPIVNFSHSLAQTIEWYTKNPDWWKSVKNEAEQRNIGADTGKI